MKNYSFGYFIEQISSLFKLPCRHNQISLCSTTNNSFHPFHPTFSRNPVHPHFTFISRKWLQMKTLVTRVFFTWAYKIFSPKIEKKKWEAKLASNRKLHFTSLYNVAQITTFLSKIEILAFPNLKFYFIYFNTILFKTPNIKYSILLLVHLNILSFTPQVSLNFSKLRRRKKSLFL